jgi:hypothetical protein
MSLYKVGDTDHDNGISASAAGNGFVEGGLDRMCPRKR